MRKLTIPVLIVGILVLVQVRGLGQNTFPPNFKDCKPNNSLNICFYVDVVSELTTNPVTLLPQKIAFIYDIRIKLGTKPIQTTNGDGRTVFMVRKNTTFKISTDTSNVLVSRVGPSGNVTVHKYFNRNETLTVKSGNERIVLTLKLDLNPLVP